MGTEQSATMASGIGHFRIEFLGFCLLATFDTPLLREFEEVFAKCCHMCRFDLGVSGSRCVSKAFF